VLSVFTNRRFLLSLCIVSMIAACVPAAISIFQLIGLHKGIADIERDSATSAQSKEVLDIVAQSLPSFTAITLDLTPDERTKILAQTDQHFARLADAVTQLRSTGSGFISQQREAALTEAIENVAHSWEEIREQTGTTMVAAEKTYHFLKIFDEIATARDVLKAIEHDAANAAAATTKTSFARVERANVLIAVTILGAALIGLIAIFSNFQFARSARRSNEQLLEKNRELSTTHLELEDSITQLTEAQDQLVRNGKLAQMGLMTATVAHEFRNPLSAVHTSTFTIQRHLDRLGVDLAKPIARINGSVDRCNKIITELLDFTRADQLRREAHNFDQWVRTAVENHADQIPEVVGIECALSAGDSEVQFDPDGMLRVLNNMLRKASEAMVGNDGISRGPPVRDPLIIVSSHRTARGIELKVTDNGPGTDVEQLSKIFEPLYSTKGFGIGLGVPAIQQVLQQHGGELEYESEIGKGTTATAWFPLELTEAAKVASMSTPEKFKVPEALSA